jgi:hypothetical protein
VFVVRSLRYNVDDNQLEIRIIGHAPGASFGF